MRTRSDIVLTTKWVGTFAVSYVTVFGSLHYISSPMTMISHVLQGAFVLYAVWNPKLNRLIRIAATVIPLGYILGQLLLLKSPIEKVSPSPLVIMMSLLVIVAIWLERAQNSATELPDQPDET